jgi:hypothetical protein
MCKPVSGLINAELTIHLPDPATWDHSHSSLAAKKGIADGLIGDKWVRFELSPKGGDFRSDIADWQLHLDEQRRVDWWGENLPEIDDKIRRAVKRYMKASWAAGAAPQSVIAATSGNATATGNRSSAANTGNRSSAANTGDWSSAANTGDWSSAANTGDWSSAANTGNWSSAANTGNRSSAANTGDWSSASVTGAESAAVTVGYRSAVRGAKGCALLAAERSDDLKLIGWVFGVVGEKDIKADVWYEAKKGKFVACDAARVKEIEDVIAKAGSEAVKPEQCGPQAK